jgi:hypothetical protein
MSPQRADDDGPVVGGDRVVGGGEHRISREKKCYLYLANLPAKTDMRTLAATIKARWVCEQAHQPLRGPILARLASSRAHDDDRLRLPPESPPQKSEAEKRPPPRRCPHCRKWICSEQRHE